MKNGSKSYNFHSFVFLFSILLRAVFAYRYFLLPQKSCPSIKTNGWKNGKWLCKWKPFAVAHSLRFYELVRPRLNIVVLAKFNNSLRLNRPNSFLCFNKCIDFTRATSIVIPSSERVQERSRPAREWSQRLSASKKFCCVIACWHDVDNMKSMPISSCFFTCSTIFWLHTFPSKCNIDPKHKYQTVEGRQKISRNSRKIESE